MSEVNLISIIKSFVETETYPPITLFYRENIQKLTPDEVHLLLSSVMNLEQELKDFLMLLYRTSK